MTFNDYLESNVISLRFLTQQKSTIEEILEILRQCISKGGTIWLAGNGGSASTASHFACDLSKGVSLKRETSVRAICLNDNIAINSAWANDFDYEDAIAKQLVILSRKNDVFFALSGSGNSKNIVSALASAKDMNITSIALLGFDGGECLNIATKSLVVGSNDMQVIENIHLVLCHWIYKAL